MSQLKKLPRVKDNNNECDFIVFSLSRLRCHSFHSFHRCRPRRKLNLSRRLIITLLVSRHFSESHHILENGSSARF
jgi:hypothetical protein